MSKGFTKFDNRILDAITSADINGTETKVMLAIVRRTHGYQREKWVLTASYLSMATGRVQRAVEKALKSLYEKKLITRERADNNKYYYSVNNVSCWQVRTNVRDCSELTCDTEVHNTSPQASNNNSYNKYNNINKNNKYNYKERKSNFTVPTPKPTAFNNFAPSGHIDYKKIEMDALKKQMERLKNDTTTS